MNDRLSASAWKRLCGLMRRFAIGRITSRDFDKAFEDTDTLGRDAKTASRLCLRSYDGHERIVWPFATKADLDEALRHPKLLCGAC